ncbi:hypothetical protein KDW_17350 [Dictyobacter vulcani]|uniref:Uncharacterized protein n=1 Tax=Dictyobacter vulcani TaxID=2607529 RepID=A0A5J4KII1_9CHLR|nr:hypothetical protein [Dictyobacter vulcani]GER87573.1 hypothetical protein KDW_17350 [Dictyobacter vulcani]
MWKQGSLFPLLALLPALFLEGKNTYALSQEQPDKQLIPTSLEQVIGLESEASSSYGQRKK